MATYKVIQDIEAEDKIVGPLSLRQFIYAGIAVLCAYMSFIVLTKGVSFLLVLFVPPMVFTGFFAFPWGRDQPTEVWALAKIRFYIKSRRRIWDQSGVKDLVDVTAPKRIERVYTNGLSQNEVQSRLTALASTLDTRGWAIKNVNTNLYDPARTPVIDSSDRLVNPVSMPQEVAQVDVTAGDDMLDPANNARAQQLDQMVTASSNTRRQELMERMRRPAAVPIPEPVPQSGPTSMQLPAPADDWFLKKPLDLPQAGSVPMFAGAAATAAMPAGSVTGSMPVAANPTPDEAALAEELREQREKSQQAVSYQHMKIIQPLGTQPIAPPQPPVAAAPMPAAPVTPRPDPATIRLAGNNDFNIATIARIANREDEHPDEVVISLHNHGS